MFPKAAVCPVCKRLVPGEEKRGHGCFLKHLDALDGKVARLAKEGA
jgi:hypothetical protein